VSTSPIAPTGDVRQLWDDLLRAFAATVDEQRTALLAIDAGIGGDDGAFVLPHLDLPSDMPPLPAELVDWARSLLRETAGLAELASDVLARHPATPARRTRLFAEPTAGSSMDQKL